MYQVIIVDDEIWAVKGLSKIIEQDAERFELIYETTDSVDALEQISIRHPDVVITDIRMPELSGIDLMRSVKERGIKTEFVVISGFAEFFYVQHALQEGAVDYQLKPFDRNTAKIMLDKLYAKLENKRNGNDLSFYSLLRDRKNNTADLLQNKFRQRLYRQLQIVLLYYKNTDFSRIAIDTGEESQCYSLKIGPRKCIYIVNSNEDKTDIICSKIEKLTCEIEKAAVSRVGKSVDLFEQLLKETEVTIMDSFVYPDKKIFFYKKAQRDSINQLEETITDLYSKGKYKQISETVLDLSNLFTDHGMGVEEAVYFWNRIALYFAKSEKDNNLELEDFDVYELTDSFLDISEMGNYLNAQYLCDKLEQSNTAIDKFFEMLRYIDTNYAETLYLRELCSEFYINMSYCCKLFQQHKNMTFSQYVTDVRINKACDLLRYYNFTVSEACNTVGYKDYFYFNKVFKKKMGCTPTEYRKNDVMES